MKSCLDIEAFILAGGASSRMGTDKSQLLIDHQTFTERIAETLLERHRLSHYRRTSC